MKNVIVVQHLRMHKSGNENVKFNGIHKTLRSARAANAGYCFFATERRAANRSPIVLLSMAH